MNVGRQEGVGGALTYIHMVKKPLASSYGGEALASSYRDPATVIQIQGRGSTLISSYSVEGGTLTSSYTG